LGLAFFSGKPDRKIEGRIRIAGHSLFGDLGGGQEVGLAEAAAWEERTKGGRKNLPKPANRSQDSVERGRLSHKYSRHEEKDTAGKMTRQENLCEKKKGKSA